MYHIVWDISSQRGPLLPSLSAEGPAGFAADHQGSHLAFFALPFLMCVDTMEQDPGSRSNTSGIEGAPGGESTSSSDSREGVGDLEASQDRDTTSKHEECTTVTDIPNRINDNAGLQTRGAHEDSDHSEDLDDSEELGGGSLVPTEENASSDSKPTIFKTNDSIEGTVTGPSDQEDRPAVSTGNADNQQTSDGWTMVDHVKSDAGTVGKGEVHRRMEKNTESIIEVQQKITKVQNSLHSDDRPRAKSLKNICPVVAKVSDTEGEFAADNERIDVQEIETDAQVTRGGPCKTSAASSQGLRSSPVAVEFATSEPDLVVSRAQGVEKLSQSKSAKETLNQSKSLKKPLHHSKSLKEPLHHSKSLKEPLHHSKSLKEPLYHSKSAKEALNHSKSLKEPLYHSKSAKETLNYSKSLKEPLYHSKSLKETSISEESLSTVSISESQKEIGISSEAPSAVSTSDAQKEVGMNREDPSTASASEAQDESSEISEAPSTVLNSEAQKEVGMSVEAPSTVSTSDNLKEVFMSPKAASTVLASEEESSVISETPSLVSTSEPQKVGPGQEAPRMVSNAEVRKGFSISSDSLSTVPTSEAQEEISRSSETSSMVPNSEVQNEVGISSGAPSRALAREAGEEIRVSSEAPSTVSTSAAQKDIGTSPEETITRVEVPSSVSAPDGLQRKASQIDKEKTKDPLQKPPQQTETTVSIHEGVLQARSEEGKKTSEPKGNVRESDHSQTSTLAFCYEEKLAQKDETIAELDKKLNLMEGRTIHFRGRLQAMEQHYQELYNDFEGLGRVYELLQRKHQDLERTYKEKETECARLLERAESYGKSYGRLKNSLTRENEEKDKEIRALRGQLEQTKQENGTLQNQMSLYEQQHANELSRGGSYLDDTKAATPALLVSALNGVKDASNNFVKVLRSSLQPGIDVQFEDHIGAVSRNGHIKFQYQAYICRILFRDFDLPHAGSSKVALPPTTYFRQYQMHDLKKTDTVERLLHSDPEIDASLQEFCFDKFSNLMEDIYPSLIDKTIDLKLQVQNKQHPRGSKLYVSFCKLAVSVWLLHRLAFSFLHPAKSFVAQRGEPFDLNRMQSVVPLDEPACDEELQLKSQEHHQLTRSTPHSANLKVIDAADVQYR